MQWKTNTKPLGPMVGEERWVSRFAFLPTRVTGNITVWLERYVVRQILVEYVSSSFLAESRTWQTKTRWQDTDFYRKEHQLKVVLFDDGKVRSDSVLAMDKIVTKKP